MHLDEQALFSDQQAITGSAASTNFINLGAANTAPGAPAAIAQDFGGNMKIPLLIQITEAFDLLTSLRVDVQVDDNNAFSSPRVVGSSGEIALADLVAGKKIPPFNVPIGVDQRYLRLNYTVAGTAPTAGKVHAGIAGGIQTNG